MQGETTEAYKIAYAIGLKAEKRYFMLSSAEETVVSVGWHSGSAIVEKFS